MTLMKSRGRNLLVLGNLCLLALSVLLYSASRRSAARPAAGAPTAASAPVASTRGGNKNARMAPVVVLRTNAFHWRQLESPDYRIYIANLRAVGCPEATLRDIILTDVMRMYAEKRGQYYQNGRDFKYWETDEKRVLSARQLEDREREVGRLEKEMPGVVRELLGLNYDREINKYFVDNKEDERRLGFLSEEKRNDLLALRDQIEGLREKIFDQVARGLPVEADSLRQIEAQRGQALAQLLSPAEMQEYELRTSATANRLRSELIGFEPSAEEFREIFERQRALDDKYAVVSEDEQTRRRREADQAALDEAIKQKLGPARAADYELAHNPEYRSLVVFASRNELPVARARDLLTIRQIAEQEKIGLLSSSNLPQAVTAETLKAIQAETERSVRELLGEKVFTSYLQSHGTWVRSLAAY